MSLAELTAPLPPPKTPPSPARAVEKLSCITTGSDYFLMRKKSHDHLFET
jgi:hypothetical protein